MEVFRILRKGTLLLAMAAIIQLILFVGLHTYRPNSYFAAAVDKEALLQKAGANRILFVGGSNLAFGLDSYKLEALVGRETINMGLHGSLGLCYMLKEVSEGARSGDSVILVPEYEQFFGEVAYGPMGLEMLEVNPHAWKLFGCWEQGLEAAKRIGGYNLEHIQQFSAAWFQHLARAAVNGQTEHVEMLKDEPPPIYERSAFNHKGDMIRHLDRPSKKSWLTQIQRLEGKINDRSFEELEKTALALNLRGISFHVVFPAVPKSFWMVNGDLANRVAEKLRAFAVNTPESSIYEDSQFFDTSYHLNAQGREIRTRELGGILAPVLHAER